MSLVRWFRRNNKKVMAVVVVIIMVGFIGGAFLRQLGQSRSKPSQVIAHYGDNQKITQYDFDLARQELKVLRMIQADSILKALSLPGILLEELLFAESNTSPAAIDYIKRMVTTQSLKITDKQIYDFYEHSTIKEVYWILLKKETVQAGIKISNGAAATTLGRIIPSLFEGKTYSQLINALITQGVPEEMVQSAFARLLAILEYANTMCANENLTEQQLSQLVSQEKETLDIGFVKFDSSVFSDTQAEPAQGQINEQFEQYKSNFAGQISSENPYGFGYKLEDMVQLEYITVKLDDISKTVTKPTQQECENFYQRNIERFKKQELFDANDPNSGQIEKIRGYGEVAKLIYDNLYHQRITSKAELIIQQAKQLTEKELEDKNIGKLELEQLKESAGSYEEAANQLTEKYQLTVYSGKTGLLDVSEIQTDKYLARLYMKNTSAQAAPVGLAMLVFAVEEIGSSILSPFDLVKPKLYENIGPLVDANNEIVALVRVIDAAIAHEPQSLEQTINKKRIELADFQDDETEESFSVRDKVVEDLKKLAAMQATREKAEEFVEIAKKDGWQEAVGKFNNLYEPKNENEPNAFQLINLTNQNKILKQQIEVLIARSQGNPLGNIIARQYLKDSKAIDMFYSLVPSDSNTVDSVPVIMEFKPDMSYFCLKNITINRINNDQYGQAKAMTAYKTDAIEVQGLALVHFNPQNILQRMNYKVVERKEEPVETDEQTEDVEEGSS